MKEINCESLRCHKGIEILKKTMCEMSSDIAEQRNKIYELQNIIDALRKRVRGEFADAICCPSDIADEDQ